MSKAKAGAVLPRAVILIQPAALGDVLLTSTLLDDLKREIPDVRIDFMTSDAAAPLLVGHPLVANRIRYTKILRNDIRSVRAGMYDWVIDPSSTPRTALVALGSGAPVRVGYSHGIRSYAYTHSIRHHYSPPLYSVLGRKRLLGTLGLQTLRSEPRIFLSADEREGGRNTIRSLGIPHGSRIVGLSVSATQPRKRWPASHWLQLCRELSKAGCFPVLFKAPGEDSISATVAHQGIEAVIVEPRPLREFLSMLSFCSVLVSVDSGPAHMARALGVRTVTLYPRGAAAVWNPGTPETTAIEAPPEVWCPQCALPARRRRRVEHLCMQAIQREDVIAAVLAQASKHSLVLRK